MEWNKTIGVMVIMGFINIGSIFAIATFFYNYMRLKFEDEVIKPLKKELVSHDFIENNYYTKEETHHKFISDEVLDLKLDNIQDKLRLVLEMLGSKKSEN